MSAYDYDSLKGHVGHKISCVRYGKEARAYNVAVECETCGTVLLDFDNPNLDDIDTVATRELIEEVRKVYAAAVKELHEAQERYDKKQEATNANRSLWAELSIKLFAALTGSTESSWHENISDLIADTMHFCKKKGIDFYELLENAQGHFADEEAEEILDKYTPKG